MSSEGQFDVQILCPDELLILSFGWMATSVIVREMIASFWFLKGWERDKKKNYLPYPRSTFISTREYVLSWVDWQLKQNKLISWQLEIDCGTTELWHSGLLLLSGSSKYFWKQLKGRMQRWHLLLKSAPGRQLGKI